ncbi:MAG: hypothetical protein WCP39_06775 [Chlamydiota bacterium]
MSKFKFNLVAGALFRSDVRNQLNRSKEKLEYSFNGNISIREEKSFFVAVDKEAPLYTTALRGSEILEKLFSLYAKDYKIDEKNLFMELSLIHLSYLYGVMGQEMKKIALLEQLSALYANREIAWKWEAETYLSLGKWYEFKKDYSKALAAFEVILSKQKKNNTFLEASLHVSRLRIASMKKEDFQLLNPVLLRELDFLKNLQVIRKLISEPVHLEAALEYVDAYSHLEKSEHSQEKRLLLLTKMKEEFSSEEDILSKDYHHSRKLLPTKDRIYQSYMRLVDAEMALCRSKLMTSLEKENYKREAERLLHSLLNEKMVVNEFMQNRLEKDLKILESKE